MTSLIVLVVFLAAFQSGYGLKCYESQCNIFPGHENCSKELQEKICGPDQVCMTQSMTMKSNTTQVTQNCTLKVDCNEAVRSQRCSSLKNTTTATHCNIECCNSDLCNEEKSTSKSPPATTTTTNATKVPSGADLTCYVCETSLSRNETSNTTSCDDPAKQECGSKLNDRCITITSTARYPKTGAVVELETKQCASTIAKHCSEICETLNSTGILLTCKSDCCSGNLCNTPHTSTTATPSKGGQSESAMMNVITIVTGILVALLVN